MQDAVAGLYMAHEVVGPLAFRKLWRLQVAADVLPMRNFHPVTLSGIACPPRVKGHASKPATQHACSGSRIAVGCYDHGVDPPQEADGLDIGDVLYVLSVQYTSTYGSMAMKVRGRDWKWSKASVEQAMRDQVPDTIQKHVVEIGGTVFPPKQVVEHVSGWTRISFTTAEAQRVLTKIGFVCREAKAGRDGRVGWMPSDGREIGSEANYFDRLVAVEAALATAQEAIAGLAARVRAIEAAEG